MPHQYYYLVTGLPDIIQDESKLSISQEKFKEEARNQLDTSDYKLAEEIFREYDHKNLLNLILEKKEPHSPLGNWNRDFLEDEIKSPDELPLYAVSFIQAYKENNPIVREMSWENQLYHLFYQEKLDSSTSFISKWFEFELNFNNILAALNCRKFQLSIEKEIIGENDIAEIIKRSNSGDFGLSRELPYLEGMIHAFDNPNLLDRERALDEIKWNYLNEITVFSYFNIETILAFMLKLRISERWLKLDQETGKENFQRVIDELKSSYEFPEDFNLTGGKKHDH